MIGGKNLFKLGLPGFQPGWIDAPFADRDTGCDVFAETPMEIAFCTSSTAGLLAVLRGARLGFASVTGSGGGDLKDATVGIARSMLRRVGAKLSTTSVTDSPTFMNSRALRGAGSAMRLNGTYPFTSQVTNDWRRGKCRE